MADTHQPSDRQILHVDDDQSFLDVTAEFLSRQLSSVDILTTTSVSQAERWMRQRRIDCVVSDYEMPRADGLEFLGTVREHDHDLPFVLYTGKGDEEIASRAVNAGVTGYLQKGGAEQHRRLANRVEHAINEYQAQVESERYSTVLDALGYPVYVVDADGRFEYVNDEFTHLVGYERADLLGREPASIKSEDSVERVDDALSRIVSSGGPDSEQVEVQIQPRDSPDIPCRDHIAALPFDREYRGCAGILRDISDQRRLNRQLVQQNEHLEQLVSVISHDLQTPLNTADTAVELAEETGEQRFFDRARRAHDRADEILEEMLALVDEDEDLVVEDTLAIGTVASEAWETTNRDGATLRVETDLVVEGDPNRLQRCLENLFANAIEHGGENVTVTVGPCTGRDAGFYVADDGPGIPRDEQSVVFEPGFTTVADGTGFGLAIVERTATAHGWDVHITESASGGARFEFTDVTVVEAETADRSAEADR